MMPDREPTTYYTTDRDGMTTQTTQVGGPSYREHADLKERVTRLEASLAHVPAEIMRLSRMSEKVEAAVHELTREIVETRKVGGGQDQLLLAIHNLADSVRNSIQRQSAQSSAAPPFNLSPTMVATVAGGLLLLGALMGQAVGVQHILGNP